MKRKQQEETVQKHKVPKGRILGFVLLVLSVLTFLAFFDLYAIQPGIFLAKFAKYLLGKGAIVFPVSLLLSGFALLLNKRFKVFWRFLILNLLYLLILAIVHHVCVEPGRELEPQYLPLGGGLVGALIFAGLCKLAEVQIVFYSLISTAVVLALVLLSTLVRWILSKNTSKHAKVVDNPKNVKINIPNFKHKEDKSNPYDREEFSEFTEDIKPKSPFKKLFGEKSHNNRIQVNSNESKIQDDVFETPVASDNFKKAEETPKQHIILHSRNDVSYSLNDRICDVLGEADTDTTESADSYSGGDITIQDSADVVAELSDVAHDNVQVVTKGYQKPPYSLLHMPHVVKDANIEEGIREQCVIIEQTLKDFRVNAVVKAVTRGPSVTRFELEPAAGVKVSSVINLADDIALKLAASGVRIEAPIPGKAAIGIEVPNRQNDTVFFREVVDVAELKNKQSGLWVGLGKDISGNIICADLSKMPHMLVAGSTGSGKSVCINTIIAGLLYRFTPDEVKLILVDPKVVELSNYNGIPHLLTPVVTDSKKAASALHWAVAEMERRYKSFADNRVRDINSYNLTAIEKMPFIVIIIDELADLMMVTRADVEDAILRLAQKARAAGIHLILATQRPSVDVITGIIKANIPSRVAFAVSSQTDSRTILDISGAEKLLGKGDMLYYPIGSNKPVRVQGAFVSDDELNKIVSFIKEQNIPTDYSEEVTEQALSIDKAAPGAVGTEQERDELFEDAVRLVMDTGQASSSMLQRKFRIGYTRAARLVDCMEELGIVSHAVGSKPRELIMPKALIEDKFFTSY